MAFKEKLHSLKVYLLQYKGIGIATAIILIILGIVSFIFPGIVGTIAIWSFLGSILVSGLFSLICYFVGKKQENKHPYNLIKGVTNLVISLFLFIPLIISSVQNGFLEALNTQTNMYLLSVTIILGIYFTFHGLFQLLSSNKVKSFGGSRITEIIMGVIQMVLGIVLFVLLVLGNNLGLSYVIGTYLLVFAITLFIELFTNPLVQDKNKIYTLKKAKPNSKNEEVEVEIV